MTVLADKIALEPVVSSNLAAYGYDGEKQILAVQFKSGAIFHFAPVDLDLMTAFARADSKGRFFATTIKGKVPGEKMTGRCPKCGADHGWIGETCADCGCAVYEDSSRRSER